MKHLIAICGLAILLAACDNSKKDYSSVKPNEGESISDAMLREFIDDNGLNSQELKLADGRNYLIYDSLEVAEIELGGLEPKNIWLSISEGQGRVVFDPSTNKYEIHVYRELDSALFNVRVQLNDSVVVNYGNFKYPVKVNKQPV